KSAAASATHPNDQARRLSYPMTRRGGSSPATAWVGTRRGGCSLSDRLHDMARALPAEELADRAAAWARSDERVLAAFGYGSLARGDASDWSDLDLLVVVKPGTRDAMWAEREEIAGRILAGDGVVFSQELAWQRPFRFQAWRKDGLQVDLTFDEGQAD